MVIYLIAESEGDFFAECEKAGVVLDGRVVTSTPYYFIDIIGEIIRDDGSMNNGKFHANLITREGLVIGIEHLSADVSKPHRCISGW